MIRTVPSGDLGLDVILGGGWRLVERLPGRHSATVLLRGGPGTGKTLLAIDVALRLAESLEGDVVVACVEMLPSEFAAQIEAGRAELVLQWREGPRLETPRVVTLPSPQRLTYTGKPGLYCGLLPDVDEEQPDVVAALEALQHEVQELGGKPVVVLIDSLITGYGFGSTVPRKNVDALMKYAAEKGHGIVLCEETIDDRPSAWAFAADTVLELDQPAEGGRRVLVRKHRYGASGPGKHELEIQGWGQPRVIPGLDSWLGKHWIPSVLRGRGWRFTDGLERPRLRWIQEMNPEPTSAATYAANLTLVAWPHLGVARKLAFSLVPVGDESRDDWVIELDPLGLKAEGWSGRNVRVQFLPTAHGAAVGVCDMVEHLAKLFTEIEPSRPQRIILGDIGAVASSPQSAAWLEAIRIITSLVSASGWGIPVIVYDSSSADGPSSLRSIADLLIELAVAEGHSVLTARRAGTVESANWPEQTLFGPWPNEIAHLQELPRPPGRR